MKTFKSLAGSHVPPLQLTSQLFLPPSHSLANYPNILINPIFFSTVCPSWCVLRRNPTTLPLIPTGILLFHLVSPSRSLSLALTYSLLSLLIKSGSPPLTARLLSLQPSHLPPSLSPLLTTLFLSLPLPPHSLLSLTSRIHKRVVRLNKTTH